MAFDYTGRVFTTPLIRAVANKDTTAVKEALSQGFNINWPDDDRGWSAVHEAAIDDTRIDCLKILLSHSSVCLNSETYDGETPLFLACQNECLQIIKLLLKYPKCNVNLSNNEGVSPLHLACNQLNINIVKLLIERGAYVNFQDINGYTPLHEAVTVNGISNRKDEITPIISYLLTHGASSKMTDYEGNYPLHFACQNGILESVTLLLTASKSIVNYRNFDGRTPLMMAVPSQNKAVLEYLLSHNADANVVDKSDMIPLHLAAHTPNFEIFNMIYNATSEEFITKYCTFDEDRNLKKMLLSKNINSLICLAIDTEDLQFLINVLESGINPRALRCPVIHAENLADKTFTLHTPISFLLENKMCDLGERTLHFLTTLISHESPLKMTSEIYLINYVDPICAALVSLNECNLQVVMSCLRFLLQCGADPDYPHGRMPFSMEQACMRTCTEAVLLLLQFSNVLEPEDILIWIEQETSTNQEKTVEALLPLAPYYIPSYRFISHLFDVSKRIHLLAPKVYSLSNYCRCIIRKQLHKESRTTPTLFQKKLINLGLPKTVYDFLCYK